MLSKAGSLSETEGSTEGSYEGDVIPMELQVAGIDDLDLSGELDADAVLVVFLKHLFCFEKDLAEDATKMETAERENLYSERVKKSNDFWDSFCVTLKTTKPVMSGDPDVLDLIASITNLMKTSGGPKLEDVRLLSMEVLNLLKQLRPVDLELLLSLMTRVSEAGKMMEGKNALLLVGASGSGKTSTLLYLAGATFEEIEVDGHFHLQPETFPDPKLERFHTSCGTNSVTSTVQCFDVQVGDETVVLCDVPGIGDTGGVEVEISNGFGMVRAIHQANSVKPVLVLSKDGMGDRFSAVSDVLDTVTKLLGAKADHNVLEALGYVFTKYDKKYEKLLCKQFAAKKNQRGLVGSVPLLALLDDIIAKTTPLAQILSPLDGDAKEVICGLWDNNRLDPKESLSTFVPKASENLLRLQLQYSVTNMEQALKGKRFQSAQKAFKQLQRLAQLLPDFRAAFEQGLATSLAYSSGMHNRVSLSVSKFRNVLEHNTFAEDLRQLEQEITELHEFEMFRANCLPNQPSADEICSGAIFDVMSAVRVHLIESGDAMDTETFLANIAVMFDEMSRLNIIRETFPNNLQAKDAYEKGAELLILGATNCVPIAESCLQDLSGNLGSLCELYGGYVQLRDFLDVHCDKGENLAPLQRDWHAVIEQLQHKASRSVNELAAAEADIAELIRNRATAVLDVSSQKNNRDFLVELAKAPCLSDNLPALLVERVKSAESSFDAQVKNYFECLAHCLMEALNDKQDLERLSFEECLSEKHRIVGIVEAFRSAESQLLDFRQWSGEVEKETSTLWVQWKEFQPELYAYNAAVKASLERLEKEGKAIICEAKKFLQRLKSSSEDATNLLQQLSDKQCWEKWEHTMQQKAKIHHSQRQKTKTGTWTSTITGWLGLGRQPSTAEQDGKTESEDTLDEILRWFQQRIRIASKLIYRAVDEEQQEELPHKLLDKKVRSISLFVVFLHLTQKKCSLCEGILKGPGILEEVTKAESGLARALDGIKNVCANYLSNKSFRKIESVLQSFAACSDTMTHMHHLLSIPATSHRRRVLMESISSCPTYGVLRKNAIVAAVVLKRDFLNLSFLDEPHLKTGNEQDRLCFYRMVLSQLRLAEEAACLEGHAETEQTRLDVLNLHNECCQHVLAETKKYGILVTQLLMNFPNNAADFKEMNVGVENLGSMSHVFSGAKEQNVARLSLRFMEEAERILSGRLSAFVNALNPDKPEDLLQPLLRLKSAAADLHRWSEKINKTIDRLMLEAPKQAENAGRFILNLAAELGKISNLEDDGNAPIAKRLLAEHKCFGFATNAVFNEATARQDIEWVVDQLRVSQEDQKQLKAMHEEFSREYKDIVVAGLEAKIQNRLDEFLISLCSEAKVLALDLSMQYEAQLISLTAHIFGLWTLCDAKAMAVAGDSECHVSTNNLKKPHPAQVVAIWTMLNYKERAIQSLQNQLCEVLTGEGKSIILGVTATILAMMGCEVDCICYSKYLSDRDKSDFSELFLRFGCKHINYGTLDDLYHKLVGRVYKLGADVMLNRTSNDGGNRRNSATLRVLLIDEVDVFFKEDFFGATFNPIATCHRDHLLKLAEFIWENLNDIRESDVIQFREAKEFLGQFPIDVHPLIKEKIREMVKDAKLVAKNKHTHPYLVKNGRICYKEFDGVTSTRIYGFETMFIYFKELDKEHDKEHDEDNITREALEKGIDLGIHCGMFSYAELPVNFDVILGVTGTLKGLRQAEKDTLKSMYDLRNFAYIPSVYGQNKLQFAADNSRDVVLCDSNGDHNFEIAAEIERRCRPVNGVGTTRRPVMVFFRTKKALQSFNKSIHAQRLKATCAVQTITEDVDPKEKEGLFGKATEAGVVSLLIRDFGRGTDFKCYDNKVLAAGGVHVIQAFYSTDDSEFIQMKGRAARQGADGSFSMVLNPTDLHEDLQISAEDITFMRNQSRRCTFLDERRERHFETEHQQLLEVVKEASDMHYRSLAFMEAARTNLRKEALDFLFEVNGVTGRFDPAFTGNKAKDSFLEERKRRVEEHNKRQREQRRTQRNEMETNLPEDLPLPLLLTAEDTSHYGVLGIRRDATNREIVRAFRRLALAYHPDRNNDENAATLFRRIQEAKEVLLCDRARAAYDRTLD